MLELIFGWESTMSTRISDYTSASFLRGDAIYYDPYVTPVLTANGFAAQQSLTIFTGTNNGTNGETGQITAMNGLGYPNKPFKIWDGEKLVDSHVRCYGDFETHPVFDGSYNKNNSGNATAFVLDSYSL